MIKPGDTFMADGVFRDLDGNAVAIPNDMITTSAVRRTISGETHALTVTPDPDQVANPGVYVVSGPTTDWLPGQYLWDVRFTEAGGTSSSTDTVKIIVGEKIA